MIIIGDFVNTTIAIPVELREKLKKLGSKGETYADIIKRLYKYGREEYIKQVLLYEDDAIPIEKALEEAERRYGP